MLETKNNEVKALSAQKIDDGNSLLPMLIVGLVLITVGYAAIMIFV